jgi:hypothetical protein
MTIHRTPHPRAIRYTLGQYIKFPIVLHMRKQYIILKFSLPCS